MFSGELHSPAAGAQPAPNNTKVLLLMASHPQMSGTAFSSLFTSSSQQMHELDFISILGEKHETQNLSNLPKSHS